MSLKDITGVDTPLKESITTADNVTISTSSTPSLSASSWKIDDGILSSYPYYSNTYSFPRTTNTIAEEELYKYQEIIFNSNISDENKIKLISLLEKLNH